MLPFAIYSTEHAHSRAVCAALAAGTGLPLVPPAPLLDGGVALYGFLRGLLPTLQTAQRLGRPWVYADRGYLGATYGDDYSGYFRVTRDGYQHTSLLGSEGRDSAVRLEKLRVKVQPWRRGGKHIVVCPPGDVFLSAVAGRAAAAWLSELIRALDESGTARAIRVRHKTEATVRPLAADLEGAHALVTYMSNTAVEAAVAGVPVFCSPLCAASVVGLSDVRRIDDPWYPDHREEWVRALASNQWTLAELRAGKANHLFNGAH